MKRFAIGAFSALALTATATAAVAEFPEKELQGIIQ